MALGRGLESLIPNKSSDKKKAVYPERAAKKAASRRENIFYIEVNKIKPNPSQPRQFFAEDALNSLADSISRHGILQPLVVTKQEIKKDHGRAVEYYIIAGERRWRAAKLAGFSQVPVIIREAEEQTRLELALIENIQRTNLSPIEEARAYQRLAKEFSLTQVQIAERVSKSREVVANKLRLLSLPYEVQNSLSSGNISEGHAKALLSLKNPEKQIYLAGQAQKKKWSVRALEDYLRVENSDMKKPKLVGVRIDPELGEYQKALQESLGAQVSFSGSKQKGRLAISFFSEEELKKIIRRLSE